MQNSLREPIQHHEWIDIGNFITIQQTKRLTLL